jgi:protein-tyrosine phosphatase
MALVQVDDRGHLFISPVIKAWEPLYERRIAAVIDLEGEIDHGVPTMPNHMLYVYFPIYDEELPDLHMLESVVALGARLVGAGKPVLSHCGMGFNRSALVAGLILNRLGMRGRDVVAKLRQARPGALFNEVFATHLAGLP